MLICNVLSANVAGSGRVVLQHTRGARSGVIVTEKSQLFSVTIVSWSPTTVASDNRGGTPDRSASSPARRISGAPPKKSIFLKKSLKKIAIRTHSDGDF